MNDDTMNDVDSRWFKDKFLYIHTENGKYIVYQAKRASIDYVASITPTLKEMRIPTDRDSFVHLPDDV